MGEGRTLPSKSSTVVGYIPYKVRSCEIISFSESPDVCPRNSKDIINVPLSSSGKLVDELK